MNIEPCWYKFRVLGYLRTGYIKVELVIPPASHGAIRLLDIFVDEIPLDMVPADLRVPNSIVWARVEDGRTVEDADRNAPPGQDSYCAEQ